MINNKIISKIAIGTILILAIAIGAIFYWQNKKEKLSMRSIVISPINDDDLILNTSDNIEKNILQSNNNQHNDNQNNNSTDEFVKNLCNNGLEKYYEDNGGYSIKISKCGNYYRLEPTALMDAGYNVIDKNGRVVALCGGMPSERTIPIPEKCKLNCDTKNLCMGIEIDCSKIQFKNTQEDKYSGADEKWYTAKRDRCFFENAFRMNEKKYCNKITEEYYKERCLDLFNKTQ